MPSPFPGMDPYLEDPGLWPDFHHRLITGCSDLLSERLRPRYYVRIEERVYVTDESDPGHAVIIPDLRIAHHPLHATRALALPDGSTVQVAEPILLDDFIELEIREARLEVIDRTNRNVVTVIEVLSPTNKVPGSRGEKSYREKRDEVMQSPSHLVEIDLLREGTPLRPAESLPPHDYLIHISRVDLRPKGQYYAIELQQRLPAIPVPLKPEDDSVSLDLQQVLNTAYDRAGYDLELDYRGPPRTPLRKESAEWADQWLKTRGVR